MIHVSTNFIAQVWNGGVQPLDAYVEDLKMNGTSGTHGDPEKTNLHVNTFFH